MPQALLRSRAVVPVVVAVFAPVVLRVVVRVVLQVDAIQHCAEALGVDYRRVRVIHGQTDLIDHGIGAHAARATVLTGGAVHVTATTVREKALEIAAELLQASPADLDIADGKVTRRDRKGGSISRAEIAKRVAPGCKLLRGRTPQLAAHGWYNTDHTVFPYGVHLATVKIDRETGQITVERFMVAYDVGRAVNPLLIEGQLVGGCVQGLGGALCEEFRHDANGEPLAVTFADYLMPTAREIPSIDIILAEDCPAKVNPLVIKGAGESGTTAVGALAWDGGRIDLDRGRGPRGRGRARRSRLRLAGGFALAGDEIVLALRHRRHRKK